MDFTGFTFNGKHSSLFGIIRVSDGSRYQEELIPASNDIVKDIPGEDGQYYFGSTTKTKNINISIAFDNVTERQLRELKKWLSVKIPCDFWYDETPYKKYEVKVTNAPNLSYICFNGYNKKTQRMERIYKGEGTINFISYNIYATNNYSKSLKDFSDEDFPTKEEWAETSGLKEDLQGEGYDSYSAINSSIKLYNAGDLPTNWILTFDKKTGELTEKTFSIGTGASLSISILNSDGINDYSMLEKSYIEKEGKIEIDTAKNMITFIENNGKRTPVHFILKKGNFYQLPVSEEDIIMTISGGELDNVKIEYNYLYY